MKHSEGWDYHEVSTIYQLVQDFATIHSSRVFIEHIFSEMGSWLNQLVCRISAQTTASEFGETGLDETYKSPNLQLHWSIFPMKFTIQFGVMATVPKKWKTVAMDPEVAGD